MKKLYLLLLVFLLLFIPATNAVTPYQLDHPIRELNGYTLREVFEGGNIVVNGDFSNGTTGWLPSYSTLSASDDNLTITGNGLYNVASAIQTLVFTYGDTLYTNIKIRTIDTLSTNLRLRLDAGLIETVSGVPIQNNWYNLSNKGVPTIQKLISLSSIYSSNADANTKRTEVDSVFVINQTSLGISSLTVEQMDSYYDYYLKAVQFEIDYYEAGLDPGEYQHIFKSILNGVKNLISEMGYVWQWLNAPIITTDMQDYSFNIDWSWDLIGVIRQIMNSAGILTLQIAFWVPSLAFAFMGIPIQISVLSLLFSNLIFLLLGWILVKSLLI